MPARWLADDFLYQQVTAQEPNGAQDGEHRTEHLQPHDDG